MSDKDILRLNTERKYERNLGQTWGQPWVLPKEKHQEKTLGRVGGINGGKTERKYRVASEAALGSAMRESLGG